MRIEVEYKVSFSFLEPLVLNIQSLANDTNLDARVNSEIGNTDTCNDKLDLGFEIKADDLLAPEIETGTLDKTLENRSR